MKIGILLVSFHKENNDRKEFSDIRTKGILLSFHNFCWPTKAIKYLYTDREKKDTSTLTVGKRVIVYLDIQMDTCIFLVFSVFHTKKRTNLSMLEFISSQSIRKFGPPNVFRVRCLCHKVSFSMYASSTLFEKPVVCCLLGSSSKIIFVSALDKEM